MWCWRIGGDGFIIGAIKIRTVNMNRYRDVVTRSTGAVMDEDVWWLLA